MIQFYNYWLFKAKERSDLNYLCAPTNTFCLCHAISKGTGGGHGLQALCCSLSSVWNCRKSGNQTFGEALAGLHVCKYNTIVNFLWSVCL